MALAEHSIAEGSLHNARLAVEWDPVRLGPRLANLRLTAAISLAPRIIVCEALLAGVPVPAYRLDRSWLKALHLQGDVVLDEELALRVVAHGPIAAREDEGPAA